MAGLLLSYYRLHKSDGGSYKRKANKFIKLDNCPLCNGTRHVFLVERQGISVHLCRNCDFGFQNSRIKSQILKKLYMHEGTTSSCYMTESQVLMDIRKFDYGPSILESFNIQEKNLLIDIGCGNGLSLQRAVLKGWNHCIGIELNKNYDFPEDSR